METHIKRARSLAHLLDNQFNIGGLKFGIDPILGLMPGIGDSISLILSTYIIWIGYKMKIPSNEIARMVKNIVIDLVVGAIPIAGDVGDFFFKANNKNLRILEKYASGIEEGVIVS